LPPLRPSLRERPQAAARTDTLPAPAETAPTPRPGGKVEIWRRRPGSSQFDRMET